MICQLGKFELDSAFSENETAAFRQERILEGLGSFREVLEGSGRFQPERKVPEWFRKLHLEL